MLVAQTCTELQSFKLFDRQIQKRTSALWTPRDPSSWRSSSENRDSTVARHGSAVEEGLFLQGLFQGWCCCMVCGFLLYVCHFFLLVEIIYLSPTSLNLQILPAVWGSKVIYGSFLRTSQLESTCRGWPCFGGNIAVQSWGNHVRFVVTQMISNKRGYYESGIQQRMGSLSYLWIWRSQKGVARAP